MLCSRNYKFTAEFAGNAGVDDFFKNKSVLIMGLGRFGGGVDVVRFLHKAGAKIIVTDMAPAEKLADSLKQLADLAGIEYHLGSHEKNDFEQADIVVANPAVMPDNEFLEIARKNKRAVTYQINIFFKLCPATIIGITGSNGKSTTTALTTHLLGNSSYQSRVTSHGKVFLTGNIGNEPFLCLLDKIKKNDLVVIEMSSFQLEELSQIQKAPHISLITNLTPNHLDRHKTFANYCAVKENIFKYQKLDEKNPAVSIFNAEDKITNGWFEKYKNDKGRTCIGFSASDVSEEIKKHYKLPGWANLQNLSAALTIAKSIGLTGEQLQPAVSTFKALPHRLELAADRVGVRWYNDSKSTTPDSTIVALQAFDEPIILIAGGYDKHIPFDTLGVEIARRAKAVILIGQTAPKIASAIRITGHGSRVADVTIANSLTDAVITARKIAQRGDVVLLSPACASYDMFENYEHRGREFARLAMESKSGA
jgi:UDP-N-acetylmuramoylalanine--D-glutamate ligase